MFIIATFYRFANTKTENPRIILHTIRTKCKLASAYLCCFCQKKKQERMRKALLFCEIIYIFSINLISISGTRIWRDGRRVSAVCRSRRIAGAITGTCRSRMGTRLLGRRCGCCRRSLRRCGLVCRHSMGSRCSRGLTCLMALSCRSLSRGLCGRRSGTIRRRGGSLCHGSGTVS